MVRDAHGLSWLGRIIAIVVLAAVYFGVYAAFFAPQLPPPFIPATAETGDFIEVDYIGLFPDTGLVFDTSIESVAKDNATFPKAATFRFRTGESAYAPLQYTSGCTSGAGCPIPGFQDAVLGMRVGEARRVTLEPEDAYGNRDPSLIEVRPLLEDVRATETITRDEFITRFAGSPVDGQVVTDITWGWNVTVRVSGDVVTIRHSPDLGQVVTVAGQWSAQVVGIDDAADEGRGAIRVRHLLRPADVDAFAAADVKGNFIVVALDEAAGTYTVDYNPEVVGKTLTFELTLKALRKGRR